MQTIQINGTMSFIDNIKELKIGDNIKLIPNKHNRINADAIGAYTNKGYKIGYVPFKSNQIDINAKYIVNKINLSQQNPILLISRNFDNVNMIHVEPQFIKEIKCNNKIYIDNELLNDLKYFEKYLKLSNDITKIQITYQDINYINILIKTPTTETLFMTVTKKYYEENIFKYDEFYNLGLIPKCIYQQFQIHRLENYLEKNYKSINNIKIKNKNKISNLKFEIINNIKFKTILNYEYLNNNYTQNQINNLIKLIIQFNIEPCEKVKNVYYNPFNYIEYNDDFKPNLTDFINEYPNIKLGGIFYNHTYKYYCNIDLYNNNNIIEIVNTNIISNELIIELLLKLYISNKNIINIYNPIEVIIHRL